MTYPKLPGLTWDGTIYENEEMGTLGSAASYRRLSHRPRSRHGGASQRRSAVLLVRRHL